MPPGKTKPAKKLAKKPSKPAKPSSIAAKAKPAAKANTAAKAKPTAKAMPAAKPQPKAKAAPVKKAPAPAKTPAKPVAKSTPAIKAPAKSAPKAPAPTTPQAKVPPPPKPKAPPVPKPVVLRKTHTSASSTATASAEPGAAATPLSTRDQKVAIRREMKDAIQKLRERSRRSREICEALVSHPSWRRSVIVAIFAPMDSEPDVELLWEHAVGKTVCYPVVRKGGLDFISVTGPESVSPGQFGIREPALDPSRVIPPHTFDLIFVPGAAFTANGDRLGRGGGFYDRVLASPGFRAFKVGVCFSRQVLDTLPLEAHDQRVHRVVTESGWLQRPDFVRAGRPNA